MSKTSLDARIFEMHLYTTMQQEIGLNEETVVGEMFLGISAMLVAFTSLRGLHLSKKLWTTLQKSGPITFRLEIKNGLSGPPAEYLFMETKFIFFSVSDTLCVRADASD